MKQTIATIIVLTLCAAATVAQGKRASRREPAKPKPAATAPAPNPKELAEAAAASRAKLMEASKTYRESLERLLELQQQDEAKAASLVASRKQLLELGVIAKRELEESEAALQESQKKIAETNQRLNEVDQLVAEVTAAEELANQPPAQEAALRTAPRPKLLVRYVGRSHWALASDYAKVDEYFRAKFGRLLPISAFGQTETHDRLGFDHSNALDVAVHPDSVEGQVLQGFLRAQGISFIAIRGAIVGTATGAHLHIGLPSKRLGMP
jgi:hypothetical protein